MRINICKKLVKIFAGEWNKYSGNETNYETIIVNKKFRRFQIQEVPKPSEKEVARIVSCGEIISSVKVSNILNKNYKLLKIKIPHRKRKNLSICGIFLFCLTILLTIDG